MAASAPVNFSLRRRQTDDNPHPQWFDGRDRGEPVAVVVPAMGPRSATTGDSRKPYLSANSIARWPICGQGEAHPKPTRANDFGFADLVADLEDVLAAADHRYGSSRILIGHSLGGHIAALTAARRVAAPPAAGLVLVAADSPYFPVRGWRGAVVLANAILAAGVSNILGYLPGDLIGGIGRQVRRLLTEWARPTATGRYHLRGLPAADADLAEVEPPSWRSP